MLVLLVQKNKQDFCLFTISVCSAQARLSTQWGHSIYEVAFESLYRGSPLSKTSLSTIPRYSTNSPILYGFLPFFLKKTAFLKVHLMYLVLFLAQYDFSIVRFPGSTKFVLSGDTLYHIIFQITHANQIMIAMIRVTAMLVCVSAYKITNMSQTALLMDVSIHIQNRKILTCIAILSSELVC